MSTLYGRYHHLRLEGEASEAHKRRFPYPVSQLLVTELELEPTRLETEAPRVCSSLCPSVSPPLRCLGPAGRHITMYPPIQKGPGILCLQPVAVLQARDHTEEQGRFTHTYVCPWDWHVSASSVQLCHQNGPQDHLCGHSAMLCTNCCESSHSSLLLG